MNHFLSITHVSKCLNIKKGMFSIDKYKRLSFSCQYVAILGHKSREERCDKCHKKKKVCRCEKEDWDRKVKSCEEKRQQFSEGQKSSEGLSSIRATKHVDDINTKFDMKQAHLQELHKSIHQEKSHIRTDHSKDDTSFLDQKV